MAFGFIQGIDSFIDFFSTHGTAGFDSVGSRQFGTGGCLGREQVAEEDMAICESFLDNESIRRVVIQGIADGGCFSCALCCMIIACCLDDFA